MRQIANILCLVLWIISFVVSVVQTVRGVDVSPITAMLPCLICIMHYAEAVYRDLYKEAKK